jgi:hypothetical protein
MLLRSPARLLEAGHAVVLRWQPLRNSSVLGGSLNKAAMAVMQLFSVIPC